MKLRYIFLLLALLFANTTKAQQLTANMKAAFDDLIDTRYKADEPGGVVLIAQNGSILYQRAFGMSDVEEHVKMQADMLFNIGSQTKQFTAVRILQLAEQGKLSVTDHLSKDIDHCPLIWQNITIENLLTHSSGISDLRGKGGLPLAARIDTAMIRPLAFQPGTKTFYANIEFEILGYIIERITGESMAVNLVKYIIDPLGLKHTYAMAGDVAVPGRISGYIKRADGHFSKGELYEGNAGGAGGLISNTKDIMAWYEALANGRVIKKETLAKAWKPYKLADGQFSKYGYGWDAGGDVQGHPIAEHGGLIVGFSTESLYLIDEHIYVGVFLNQRSYADATAQELAAIALAQPYPAQSMQLSEQALQAFAGTYADDTGNKKQFNLRNGKLYYEPQGAQPLQLMPYAKNKFYLENTLVVADIIHDVQGKVLAIKFSDRRFSGQPGWQWNKTE
ncbi:serine hydrolase domain-containing protein [Mucilaginibacter calamicampi]|uniref:Serine hydrolase domain-containing protein n=1 Tax=Mucilaginibacter calamicampi TaxID=1302352 RepID=A0ABW2YVZ5_9SPHI